MTEFQLRQSVVDIMQSWVGATKGSSRHQDILKIYNSYKPLARSYTVQSWDDYCATTVSAAYIKAGVAFYTGTECGVEKYTEVAKRLGIWIENDAHVPKPGDAIVYDWQDNGVGDCTGFADHIGIVTKVVGTAMHLAEGNMSGGVVGTRILEVNAKYIRGFICPNFAAIAKRMDGVNVEVKPTETTKPSRSELGAGRIVRAGDTLGTIAKELGVSVAELVRVNQIKNPDIIHVGDVIYASEAAAAIARLAAKKVINSPDYWLDVVDDVKHLDTLIIKAEKKIQKGGMRTSTVEEGIDALVEAGVINSPDYWLKNHDRIANLGNLICALGGAVR